MRPGCGNRRPGLSPWSSQCSGGPTGRKLPSAECSASPQERTQAEQRGSSQSSPRLRKHCCPWTAIGEYGRRWKDGFSRIQQDSAGLAWTGWLAGPDALRRVWQWRGRTAQRQGQRGPPQRCRSARTPCRPEQDVRSRCCVSACIWASPRPAGVVGSPLATRGLQHLKPGCGQKTLACKARSRPKQQACSMETMIASISKGC